MLWEMYEYFKTNSTTDIDGACSKNEFLLLDVTLSFLPFLFLQVFHASPFLKCLEEVYNTGLKKTVSGSSKITRFFVVFFFKLSIIWKYLVPPYYQYIRYLYFLGVNLHVYIKVVIIDELLELIKDSCLGSISKVKLDRQIV